MKHFYRPYLTPIILPVILLNQAFDQAALFLPGCSRFLLSLWGSILILFDPSPFLVEEVSLLGLGDGLLRNPSVILSLLSCLWFGLTAHLLEGGGKEVLEDV